jgi:hypothetical protein
VNRAFLKNITFFDEKIMAAFALHDADCIGFDMDHTLGELFVGVSCESVRSTFLTNNFP